MKGMSELENYIDTFIIKTAAICNLNCTYCYYYNGVDTSYIGKPKVMDRQMMTKIVDQIVQHAISHNLKNVDVTLHGGEPLLMGKEHFTFLMEELNRIDFEGVETRRKIQTNGVTLNNEWLQLLLKYNVNVGVSIDGPKEVNDKNRLDIGGKGTYDRASRGLNAALSYEGRGLNTSVLSVINPHYSGRMMYNHLRDLGISKMDFLLPEGNYANPPFDIFPSYNETPFADYLIEVFDAWIEEDNPDVTVRLLDRMIRTLLGGDAKSDVIGNSPVRVAVIETDGSIEPTDNFKMCEDGMTNMGLSIFHNDFDDLCNSDFFKEVLIKDAKVPKECDGCKFIDKCGGGRLTTRYSQKYGFQKRTVFCYDLYKVFDHIDEFVNSHSVV